MYILNREIDISSLLDQMSSLKLFSSIDCLVKELKDQLWMIT